MATTDSKFGVGSVVEMDSVRAQSTQVLRSANLTSHPRQVERLAAAANPPAAAVTFDGDTLLATRTPVAPPTPSPCPLALRREPTPHGSARVGAPL